jgi:aldose 1-epimerase
VTEQDILQIRSGPLELELAPWLGGSIARFRYLAENEKINIFRDSGGIPQTVLDSASFPLVPFCNRIRDGRFTFRGREVTLAANMPGDPNPLHGQGWLGAWEVEEANDSTAELLFRHDGGEWPWRYEARQSFRLEPESLTIRLGCRNMSDEPMPCGLGQHPYFHCDAETLLDTGVTHAWTIDEDVLPVARVSASGRYDLAGHPVCGRGLDNGFGGWSGTARMRLPGAPFTLEMRSDDASFFQLYSPAAGGIFVAEPVTHANAALNEPEESWTELGLRVLEPGEEMVLTAAWSLIVD